MRLRSLALALTSLAFLVACGSSVGSPHTTSASVAASPRAAATGVKLARVGTFSSPLFVTAPAGDRNRVFVVEQTGKIRVVRKGKTLSTPFLDLSGQVSCCGEQGLLSMAFAPDYASSKRFYVDYTDKSGNTQVVEYRASSADRADAGSARRVLSQDQPEPNHNGGLLVFGPDKLLYVGLGDGGGADDQHGSPGNGQSLGTLLGKILRIDPKASGGAPYTVPASNPFRGRGGARPEIYLYGVRNPWRFSFDRSTGDLVIGDVGQGAREEIEFFPKGKGIGRNLGWRPREGRAQNPTYPGETAPGAFTPQFDYTHAGGNCSITGGYVVRDTRVPSLRGRYLFGDYCKGEIFSLKLSASGARSRRSLGLTVPQLTSFGEDALGRVYVTSGAGAVYRIAAK